MIDQHRLEGIVREAGRMALACWPGAGHAVKQWDKTPGNPVSAADLAVDSFLKRELAALLPAAGWLSEETADRPERLAHGLCCRPHPQQVSVTQLGALSQAQVPAQAPETT